MGNIFKPRKSVLNARALMYRRVTRIEKSRVSSVVYKCLQSDDTYETYMYDADNNTMIVVDVDELDINPQYITIDDSSIVLNYDTTYFYWDGTNDLWVSSASLPEGYSSLLDAGFSPISNKYNTNYYYFVGSFDYMITGDVSSTETQTIKGNITPLTSMNIKYYDDYIKLSTEDLVVIDNRLYSVESVEFSIKHQPRQYKVYYATLNSIL